MRHSDIRCYSSDVFYDNSGLDSALQILVASGAFHRSLCDPNQVN
jgi:hypothetical protein